MPAWSRLCFFPGDANRLNSAAGSQGWVLRVRRRFLVNAAAIGLINLIYNLARYESRFRIGTATDRRLNSED
jgi:hypothetical protein